MILIPTHPIGLLHLLFLYPTAILFKGKHSSCLALNLSDWPTVSLSWCLQSSWISLVFPSCWLECLSHLRSMVVTLATCWCILGLCWCCCLWGAGSCGTVETLRVWYLRRSRHTNTTQWSGSLGPSAGAWGGTTAATAHPECWLFMPDGWQVVTLFVLWWIVCTAKTKCIQLQLLASTCIVHYWMRYGLGKFVYVKRLF